MVWTKRAGKACRGARQGSPAAEQNGIVDEREAGRESNIDLSDGGRVCTETDDLTDRDDEMRMQ